VKNRLFANGLIVAGSSHVLMNLLDTKGRMKASSPIGA